MMVNVPIDASIHFKNNGNPFEPNGNTQVDIPTHGPFY